MSVGGEAAPTRAACRGFAGQTLVAETEGHAHRCAPEVEVAQTDVQIVIWLVVLKRPQVPDVASETHVVVEEAMNARADVEAEVIRVEVVEKIAAGRARSDQTQSCRAVRPEA